MVRGGLFSRRKGKWLKTIPQNRYNGDSSNVRSDKMQNNTLSRPGFSLSGTALKRIACLSMLHGPHRRVPAGERPVQAGMRSGRGMFSWTAFCGWRGGWPFPSTASCWWRASSTPTISKNTPCGCWASPSSASGPSTGPSSPGVYWGHQNVYFTLLLGLLAMKALDTFQTPEGMPALERHPRGGSLLPRGGAAPL